MMRVLVFDTHRFERDTFERAFAGRGHDLRLLEPRLTVETAPLADGAEVVCSFVNDRLDAPAIARLAAGGVRLIALRSAGFNHVDVDAAHAAGLAVVRVPEYSPYAVAEHAMALLLALVRHLPRAAFRVREMNFALDGLVGFDLHGKTVGVVGTGRIGAAFARICLGFGCRVLVFDHAPNPALVAAGAIAAPIEQLYAEADVLSLHVPLTPATHHLLDAAAFARMKRGAILVNTSRGGLLDTPALIEALKSGHLGGAALDVYEEEEGLFFRDLSDRVLTDDVLARLMTFPNVLLTAHQGFLTREALEAIARTTADNIDAFARGDRPLPNSV